MSAKIIDVIKYEGDNKTLIYKHPTTDFNKGTQLIVHQSQEAVFFKDGKALESFFAGRHTLDTDSLPLLTKALDKMAAGEHIFHSEVYFINLTTELGIKWGTDSKIRFFDPVSGLHLEIGASGTFNIKVNDGRKLLLKVVGTASSFKQEEIFGSTGYSTINCVGQFRGMIVSKVKNSLAKVIRERDIDILEIDERLEELSDVLKEEINKVLDDYGMVIPEFFISSIVTPDDDPNFQRLREQHAERFLRVQQQRIELAEAEEKQKVEIVKSETKAKKEVVEAEGHAKATVIQGKAEAEVLQAKGGNYQSETARIVGEAAAKNEAGGGASIVSEVVKAGIGVGVGVQMAKNVVEGTSQASTSPTNTWECPSCHHFGNKGLFCEECGTKRIDTAWNCPNCGATNLTTKFCPHCGQKKEG